MAKELTLEDINNQILLIDQQILTLQKRRGLLEEFQKTFIILEKNTLEVVNNPTNDEDFKDYPFTGTKEEKIIYYIKRTGRAVKSKEIEDFITKIEGPLSSRTTLKSFYHILKQKMVPEGQIAFLKYEGSNKHTFYALPEFLDNEKKLKDEHMPSEESWGKYPIENRYKIKTSKWTKMKAQ